MRVSILDLEMGNLRSVQKAFEAVGATAALIDWPDEVAVAERLVLPGVGAFGDAMSALTAGGLDEAIVDFVATGRPFLGICLGLQLLFERGHEHGTREGLAILAGEVRPFPEPLESGGGRLKVPHMGWNTVRRTGRGILAALDHDPVCYFVHSYVAVPTDPAVVASTTEHGIEFCSAVSRDNVHATQFHPEKSQRVGLSILESFLTT